MVAKKCIFTNAMCMNNMISSKCGQKYLFEVNLWGTKTILKPACALAEKSVGAELDLLTKIVKNAQTDCIKNCF